MADTDELNFDEDCQQQLSANIGVIVGSAMASVVTSVAMAALTDLVVTHIEKKDISSSKEVTPTEDNTALESRSTTGAGSDSSLAQDNVSAQKGSVDAADTQAKAAEAGTKATIAQSNAVETAAGASDISTKALKMN